MPVHAALRRHPCCVSGKLPIADLCIVQTPQEHACGAGSKAFCIGELLKKGYAPEHVLMCGCALGDPEAAKKNGVFYCPILVKHEKEIWAEFLDEGLGHLTDDTYGGKYQEKKTAASLSKLGG